MCLIFPFEGISLSGDLSPDDKIKGLLYIALLFPKEAACETHTAGKETQDEVGQRDHPSPQKNPQKPENTLGYKTAWKTLTQGKIFFPFLSICLTFPRMAP